MDGNGNWGEVNNDREGRGKRTLPGQPRGRGGVLPPFVD